VIDGVMANAWRDIRDQALRPIYPIPVIEQFLVEQAVLLTAERIADRAYARELIIDVLGGE
jgi:hypothetical protein